MKKPVWAKCTCYDNTIAISFFAAQKQKKQVNLIKTKQEKQLKQQSLIT